MATARASGRVLPRQQCVLPLPLYVALAPSPYVVRVRKFKTRYFSWKLRQQLVEQSYKLRGGVGEHFEPRFANILCV